MKKFGLLLASTFLVFSVIAQNDHSLFIAKENLKAYQNKTRSFNGLPGENYWQNHASYTIKAELIPSTRMIEGEETIVYSNNSPDSLKMLVFNLFQDIYKKGTARDWPLGPEDIHDGVFINSLVIGGNVVDMSGKNVNRIATLLMVSLAKAIAPNEQISIQVKWSLVLPGIRTVRMGTYENENFMVAYWFPRLVVYDDIFGWNSIPYVGNCEFYNDFCNFDVTLTLPENYLVWSSGTLQNAEEIYHKNLIQKINKSLVSDKVHHIITTNDWKEEKIFVNNQSHAWKFKAENIVDFAFAATNSYLWDATSCQLDSRRIAINAVYKPESKDFPQVAEIAKNVIDFYSNSFPKIPFPFPQMTAFNGRGGMEFPGMVNDGDAADLNGTLYLTAHEIGHSYFPFYTGLNEQRYAWMDEGLITFFPRKFVAKYSQTPNFSPFAEIVTIYNKIAASSAEIPLMIPSTNTGQSYRYHAYGKSSTAFYELEKYIGADTFALCLQEFTKRWNGKHPTPYDFFFSFNEVAGEDLSWFWKPWFFEMTYADLSLDISESNLIRIINKGGNPVAVNLNIVNMDGSRDNISFEASVWKNGKKEIIVQLDKRDFKSLELDTKLTPDAFPDDNLWTKE